MSSTNIVNCFKNNELFWKVLGIHPQATKGWLLIYSNLFVIFFIIVYDFLLLINFYYLPRRLDVFIEELILYLTTIGVASKVLTFVFLKKNIEKLLEILKSDIFQPENEEEYQIVYKANKFNIKYWRIVALVSFISYLSHIVSPFLAHLFTRAELNLPVCSYSFLSENTTQQFIYPIYLYQSIGIYFQMLYNINIDTFILGIMIFLIAQLDILAMKLKNVTNTLPSTQEITYEQRLAKEASYYTDGDITLKLNEALERYNDVTKFCYLIEEIFSISLFTQFGIASGVICVCLFRFTLPASWQYYIFLGTYMFVMIIQILVPSWFGTRIMDKSYLLSPAIYSCDWIPRSPRFKSSMRIFVERANRPLSITGWKMFPMSLSTFTSIMNSSYSIFTLLRHMESMEDYSKLRSNSN